MSKSALYTANTTTQSVDVNGLIAPGTIIRRFGPNINLSGNAIQICGTGYYDIDSNFTVVPSAAGEVTITAYLNNVPIPGGSATETASAADDSVNLTVSALVRENCPYCEGISTLTFVLTGTASTVTNSAIVIDKL